MQAFIHSRHHDTSKHATYLSNSCKNGRALCNLKWFAGTILEPEFSQDTSDILLPRSQDVYRATIQTGFEKSLEEADNAKLGIRFAGCGAHG
jgi:homoaconitase/3-isopropylmalate dehydratase large subunit